MIIQSKRERLIDSAAKLFHRSGINATSLADIARDADIPIGNVYYYFKTKEELAQAAMAKQKQQFAAAYARLDEGLDDPRRRLIEALGYFNTVREEYTRYGCPVARTVQDADTETDAAARMAAEVLSEFTAWAERQFLRLGHGGEARGKAVSLIAGLQGAILMAKAFRDPEIISGEIERLTAWLESVPNKKIQLGKVGAKTAEAAG